MISLFPELERSFAKRYLNETAEAMRHISVTIRKCSFMLTPIEIMRVEKPTPTIPPALQRP